AETIHYLQQASGDPNALAVFADDGEKFGAWPGTHDFIFTRGWLEDFFSTLEDSPDVQLITPQKYFEAHQASLETVVLPAGSYAEMMDWSGGNWRHFLDRYAESHDMWQAVSDASARVRAELAKARPTSKVRRAYDHVLRAQSNDAYWHGTFGGLYLRHLRQSIYHELAAAKVLCNPTRAFARAAQSEEGTIELQNTHQSTLCRPRGGALFNWTSLAAHHNLLSTLRRHSERYHDASAPVDWYGRGALLDHFLRDDTTPETFASACYGEQGDFISEPWTLEIENQKDEAAIIATRNGGVWVGEEFRPLHIRKRVALAATAFAPNGDNEDTLDVSYEFFNPDVRELSVWWAHEWNLALSAWSLPERHYHADDHKTKMALDEAAQFAAVQNPIVADRWLKCWVEWQWPQPMKMWHVPLWTHSQKEGGDIEKSYQQSSFVWSRRLTLAPKERLHSNFRVVLRAKL
ncbi:MAG: 4-alpha-glucanotransferase, partial [Abditibacteriota bacterium]|nr:4-alpha-glucanotransferase [Abditibacteriota bacterium]